MAYYMRSNNASSHGNYMMSNSSMQGGYLMHSAKGTEWSKGHKYKDKRWFDGAWHYLYEIPKEYAQKAGEAVKETAEKAVDTVKDTAQKATKAAKDFKDYSKNVDSRVNRYKEDIQKREDIAKSTTDRQNAAELQLLNNAGKAEEAYAEAKKYERELKSVESVYGKNSEQARVMRELYEDATQTAREISKEDDDSQIKAVNAVNAHARNEVEKEQSEKGLEIAERDKESAKYKASKALNAIDDMIDDASGSAKQGLQWLKNQLNSGADWTTDQIEKIRESDAVASLSGKLENLYANTNSKAAKTGLNIINQLIGWGNLGSIENVSRSSRSSSGRNYSGTGNKAQRREAVAGGPVSDNDYRRRPKR